MKLYILPIETACNASCNFCITKFREMGNNEVLPPQVLEAILRGLNISKIEITGGGEPTLHPDIERIIEICVKKAPTQLYTHGGNLKRIKNLISLEYLCISRAHNNGNENEGIMGVSCNFDEIIKLGVPLKLSLLLHNSGISTIEEVRDYLSWASARAQKVVIRQLFDHDYKGKLEQEHVSSEHIFQQLGIKEFKRTAQGNPTFNIGSLECEIEIRSCACEMNNPVLHANGILYQGWSSEIYDPHRN